MNYKRISKKHFVCHTTEFVLLKWWHWKSRTKSRICLSYYRICFSKMVALEKKNQNQNLFVILQNLFL